MPGPAAVVTTYHATTFAERGVNAPFTSETLVGARFRRAASSSPSFSSRSGFEAVIPNPSGGRGVYVVPWSDIRELFRPTLHDLQLGEAVGQMLRAGGELTPIQMRNVGRKVAQEGLAGRAAATAAKTALAREQARTAAAGSQIVQRLGQATGASGSGSVGDQGARAALAAAAVRISRPPAIVAMAVQRLAKLFADQGIGPDTHDAPVHCLMQQMRALASVAAADTQQVAEQGVDPNAVFKIADTVLRLADHLMATLRARSDDMLEFVRSVADEPEATISLHERSEWLLDGWSRICLVWQTANAFQARSSTPSEMASLIPVLPDEADDWFGLPPGTAAKIGLLRKTDLPRAQNPFSLDAVARNEHLRTLAA